MQASNDATEARRQGAGDRWVLEKQVACVRWCQRGRSRTVRNVGCWSQVGLERQRVLVQWGMGTGQGTGGAREAGG
jgi:hypothetical protein